MSEQAEPQESIWALNLLIAEKVMGWRWVPGEHFDVTSVENPLWLLPPGMLVSDVPPGEWTFYHENEDPEDEEAREGKLTLFAVPQYATQIKDAWQIVQRFTVQGYYITLQNTIIGRWSCSIRGLHRGVSYENATTASMAICRAALKAKEEGV